MFCVVAHQYLRKNWGLWLTQRPDWLAGEAANEWGGWEISSFVSLSQVTQHLDHFPNTQATGDGVFCTACAHMWVSTRVCVHSFNGRFPRIFPVLCIFSAKPISSLLRLGYCVPSVVIILHYWLFVETESLAEALELALLPAQWRWHMLTLHKYIITGYTCRPLPHLTLAAERSSRRWLRWQFPEGGSDR